MKLRHNDLGNEKLSVGWSMLIVTRQSTRLVPSTLSCLESHHANLLASGCVLNYVKSSAARGAPVEGSLKPKG